MERLPGFRDFYPDPLPNPDVWSASVRQYVFETWRDVARRYGFREYDGPPLEPLELFTTKSGAEIVAQLYNFQDKGGRDVSMRPEMTPTLARMAAAHERNYKKPFKWFAIPQLFRYERQQKGRLREHFQFNADILGETDASADAELVAMLIDTLRAFGLTAADFVIRLSSRNAWQDYFQSHGGNPDKAYEFYQVIDKLERDTPENNQQKLATLGFSLEAVTAFIQEGKPTAELEAILINLTARGLRDYVKIDYSIIRGLAYYTGMVFEAFDIKGENRAIAGGGRYDNLVKLISGKVQMPALGFGMGDVVLVDLLKERGLLPKFKSRVDAYCLVEDETLRGDSLRLIEELRQEGCSVEYSFTPSKSDKQFKRALELEVISTVKWERSASGETVLKLKNIQTRQELQLAPVEVPAQIKVWRG